MSKFFFSNQSLNEYLWLGACFFPRLVQVAMLLRSDWPLRDGTEVTTLVMISRQSAKNPPEKVCKQENQVFKLSYVIK